MSIIKKASITILGMTTIMSAMEKDRISFVDIKQKKPSTMIKPSIWPHIVEDDGTQTAYKDALCLIETENMKFNIKTGYLEGTYGSYKVEEPCTRVVGGFSPNGVGFAKAGVFLEQDSFDTYRWKNLTFYVHCWNLNKKIINLSGLNKPTSDIAYTHEASCRESKQGVICAPVMCATTEDGKYFAAKHSCGATYIFRLPSYMRN